MKYCVAPWCMVALTLPGMIDGEDRPGSWRVDLTPCRVTVDPRAEDYVAVSAECAVLNEADKEVLIVLMAHTRGRGVACLKVKFRDEDLTAPDGLRFPLGGPRVFMMHCENIAELKKALEGQSLLPVFPEPSKVDGLDVAVEVLMWKIKPQAPEGKGRSKSDRGNTGIPK